MTIFSRKSVDPKFVETEVSLLMRLDKDMNYLLKMEAITCLAILSTLLCQLQSTSSCSSISLAGCLHKSMIEINSTHGREKTESELMSKTSTTNAPIVFSSIVPSLPLSSAHHLINTQFDNGLIPVLQNIHAVRLEVFTPRPTAPPAGVMQGLLIRPPPLPVLLPKHETTVSTTDHPYSSTVIRLSTVGTTVPTFDRLTTVSENISVVITTEGHQKSESEKHVYAKIFGDKTFADPLYEKLVPVILAICLMTTLAFVFMLCIRLHASTSSMSRTSCLLLISVATSDALTMCFAAAEIGYLYSETMENSGFLLPDKCRMMMILERLSAIPHMTSTWLTVILAIQRYLCVSRPFAAERYVSVKSSSILIIVVCGATLSLHMCRFFDKTFTNVVIHLPTSFKNDSIATCDGNYANWIKDPTVYESCFAWIRIAVAQFIPCVLLVSFVCLMVRKLQRTTLITAQMQSTHSKVSSERRQLSMFVSVVAIIVFTIETSSGLFLSINAWSLSTGEEVFSYESQKTASILFDLILYVSYFAVFLIYCLMSKDTRKSIVSVCFLKNCRKRETVGSSGNNLDDKEHNTSNELSNGSNKSNTAVCNTKENQNQSV